MANRGDFYGGEKQGAINLVDWLTHSRVGANGPHFRKTKVVPEAVVVDNTSTANVVYVGEAEIGSATSAAVWRIQKVSTSSGISLTWADANEFYDNVWDDRTSLSYS